MIALEEADRPEDEEQSYDEWLETFFSMEEQNSFAKRCMLGLATPRGWEYTDECETCIVRPGSPTLCVDCLERRARMTKEVEIWESCITKYGINRGWF